MGPCRLNSLAKSRVSPGSSWGHGLSVSDFKTKLRLDLEPFAQNLEPETLHPWLRALQSNRMRPNETLPPQAQA